MSNFSDPKTVTSSCRNNGGEYLHAVTVNKLRTVIDPKAQADAEQCAAERSRESSAKYEVEDKTSIYSGPGGTVVTEYFNVVRGTAQKLEGGCRR